jgi:hypothetical protein
MIVEELGGLSENADAIGKTGISGEKLLLVLTAAYAAMIQNWEITPKDELTYKMAVFRALTNGVLAVRRGELQAVRIEIARERLELVQDRRRNISASSSDGRSSASSRVRPGASEPRRSESTVASSGQQAVPADMASKSDANPASQSLVLPTPLSHQPFERSAGNSSIQPKNASDYLDSLGLSPWRGVSLAGSRLFTLPTDDSLDGLGAAILPKRHDGSRAKPLSTQIQSEKLAA